MRRALLSNSTAGLELWRCAPLPCIDSPWGGWLVAEGVLLGVAAAALLAVGVAQACRCPPGGVHASGNTCTWCLDSTKLLVGQAGVGAVNLVGSSLLLRQGQGDGGDRADQCVWYVVAVLSNTLLGLPLSFCGLRAVEAACSRLPHSGDYGSPPDCCSWLAQILVWLGVVVGSTAAPLALGLWPVLHRPLAALVRSLASVLGTPPPGHLSSNALLLSLVVLLLTIALVWLQYSFVRSRRRPGSLRGRMSSAEVAKAAAAAVGEPVWYAPQNADSAHHGAKGLPPHLNLIDRVQAG